MDSLETIFLKRLIHRLLQYSIIAPEINFARRCHLISLDFQEKIFVDCNRIILFISIKRKYLQCGEPWRCHCAFFFKPVSTPVFEWLFKRFCFCCCCCCFLLFFTSQLPSTAPEKFRCHDDKHDQLLTG